MVEAYTNWLECYNERLDPCVPRTHPFAPRVETDIVILPTNNGHTVKRLVVPQTLPG